MLGRQRLYDEMFVDGLSDVWFPIILTRQRVRKHALLENTSENGNEKSKTVLSVFNTSAVAGMWRVYRV